MCLIPKPLWLWPFVTAAQWANGQRPAKELLAEGAQLSSLGDRLGV